MDLLRPPAGEIAGEVQALFVALARDQVDHAADRARAIQRGHRTADHLDALDIGECIDAEIERARGIGCIVQRHAVTQHQHLVGVGAANEHAGIAAGAPGLADTQARDGGECVGQRRVATLLDGLSIDHRDAGGDVVHRCRNARGGNDDFRIGVTGSSAKAGVAAAITATAANAMTRVTGLLNWQLRTRGPPST